MIQEQSELLRAIASLATTDLRQVGESPAVIARIAEVGGVPNDPCRILSHTQLSSPAGETTGKTSGVMRQEEDLLNRKDYRQRSDAMVEAISDVEPQTKKGLGPLSLSPRKLEEMEFHNQHRDQNSFQSLSDTEVASLRGNKKFYSTTQVSNDYFRESHRNNSADRVVLDYAVAMAPPPS